MFICNRKLLNSVVALRSATGVGVGICKVLRQVLLAVVIPHYDIYTVTQKKMSAT